MIVPGGNTALDSQYNGLREIKRLHKTNEDIYVLVHDGVRPLIDVETITKNIKYVEENGNAITVVNAIETVVTVNENDEIVNIYERDCCKLARTTQTFKFNELLDAHERSIKMNAHNYINSASFNESTRISIIYNFREIGQHQNYSSI